MALTQSEVEELEKWLQASSVANMAVERPVVPSVSRLGNAPVGVLLGGDAKLSESSQRREAEKAKRAERYSRACKAKAQAARKGRYHHKRKEKTKTEAAWHRWKTQPRKSLMYGYGSWDVSQEEWDLHMGPFWEKYNSRHLYVKRRGSRGTRDKPYRMYDLELWYEHTGQPRKLFDGNSLLIYELSSPNSLDIEKAPLGGLMFGRNRWKWDRVKKALVRRKGAPSPQPMGAGL